MSDQEPNKEESKAPRKSLKDRFIDNFVIVVLVAAATAFINYLQDKNTADFETANKAFIDSVQIANRYYLDSAVRSNKFKSDSALQNQIQAQQLALTRLTGQIERSNDFNRIQDQLRSDIQKIDSIHSKEIAVLIAETIENRERQISQLQLEFISQQLSEFYWPIYSRLEKHKYLKENIEETFIKDRTDTLLQLKNHLEIIDILESKMHLAIPNQRFTDATNKYIEYVSLFEAFNKMRFITIPQNLELNFPNEFYLHVKNRTIELQAFYSKNYIDKYDSVGLFTNLGASIGLSGDVVNLEKVRQLEVELDRVVTIKKSWNDKPYFNKVDDAFQVVFLEHILSNNSGYFDFQFVDSNGEIVEKNRHFVKQGDMIWLDHKRQHYQIYLEEIYTTKDNVIGSVVQKKRLVAKFRLRKW